MTHTQTQAAQFLSESLYKAARDAMYAAGQCMHDIDPEALQAAVSAILAKLQAATQAAKPLFAVAVAARKWAELQEQGHRMQSISFDGGPGGAGTIDPWGVVRWSTPAEPAQAVDMRKVLQQAEYALWVCSEHNALHHGKDHNTTTVAVDARNSVLHALAALPVVEPAQAGELPDEREAFEAWFDAYHSNACAEFGGIDCTNPKGVAEDAWQARAALAARKPLTDAVVMREVNDVGLVPVVLKPFTPAQRRRLWVNSPEHHKDATSITGFERIVTLTERAHSINGLEVKP